MGFQSEFGGGCDLAKQLADFDLWRVLWSEFSRCDVAKQPSDSDLWTEFQSEFGSRFNSVWSASNLLARNVYRHHSVGVGSRQHWWLPSWARQGLETKTAKRSKERFAYISLCNLSAANGMMNLEARCYFYVPSFWRGSQGLEPLRWWLVAMQPLQRWGPRYFHFWRVTGVTIWVFNIAMAKITIFYS